MGGRRPIPPRAWRSPVHLVAFGLGAGAAPFAPGTCGTLLAIPLYLLLQDLAPGPYLALVALLFAVGVWACGATARALGVHDHPAIVFDEVVGFLLTMTAAPRGWVWLALGFLLFRLFDIWKPWPIGWADRRVSGGLGIMLDDVLAAVYAWAAMQAAAAALTG